MWFVGVPVSFAAEPNELIPAALDVNLVPPGDRHLTLVFLGQAPSETALHYWVSVPRLVVPAQVRALRWEPFGRSALALSIADDDGLLRAASDVCHLAATGVIEVRQPSEHRPHVTMARVPRRGRPPSKRTLRSWAVPPGTIDVGPVTLFRSRTRHSGDRYEVVDQRPRPAA